MYRSLRDRTSHGATHPARQADKVHDYDRAQFYHYYQCVWRDERGACAGDSEDEPTNAKMCEAAQRPGL
jgi:hypothetical protein